MNPNDIQVAGPLYLFFWHFIEWLNPIVYLVGLGVAVWAFMRSRKKGYFVVALYFALVLFSLFAMPPINRAIRAHRSPDISEQTQQKINVAVQDAIHKVLVEEGQPYAPPQKQTIHFPFGPLLLVVGLWLVARHEPRADRANKSLQATATAPGSLTRL